MCVITENNKFITFGGDESIFLWFRLKINLVNHVSTLASCSKGCFLLFFFGLFSGLISTRRRLVFTVKEPEVTEGILKFKRDSKLY